MSMATNRAFGSIRLPPELTIALVGDEAAASGSCHLGEHRARAACRTTASRWAAAPAFSARTSTRSQPGASQATSRPQDRRSGTGSPGPSSAIAARLLRLQQAAPPAGRAAGLLARVLPACALDSSGRDEEAVAVLAPAFDSEGRVRHLAERPSGGGRPHLVAAPHRQAGRSRHGCCRVS
jgi:hypothetical protein